MKIRKKSFFFFFEGGGAGEGSGWGVGFFFRDQGGCERRIEVFV